MAIKIKAQKNYYVTEVSIDLPSSLSTLDEVMRAMKSTGKIVSVYSDGGRVGINVEQKTRIPSEEIDQKIRELLSLKTKEF